MLRSLSGHSSLLSVMITIDGMFMVVRNLIDYTVMICSCFQEGVILNSGNIITCQFIDHIKYYPRLFQFAV